MGGMRRRGWVVRIDQSFLVGHKLVFIASILLSQRYEVGLIEFCVNLSEAEPEALRRSHVKVGRLVRRLASRVAEKNEDLHGVPFLLIPGNIELDVEGAHYISRP
jgi:hypothetical protein